MKLAETAFGRFFCFLPVFRARGGRWPGLLMLRGTQKSSPRPPPATLPASQTTTAFENLAELGVRVGDDFCVPPQHEEPTLTPSSAYDNGTNKKPPEGGFENKL